MKHSGWIMVLLFLPLLPLSAQTQEEQQKAFQLYQAGKSKEALEDLARLEKKYPGGTIVPHLRARIFHQQKKYKEAIAEMERSLKLGSEPKWVVGWNYAFLGLCYKELGEEQKAIKYLKDTIALKATSNSVKMASKALGEITGETIEEPPHPLVGTEAPPFSLPDMYGRTVTNADFKDKVAVLQIGTTW